MHEIVVVGAGQLGSRHLQGLARLHASARLHMVEPAQAAIELARARVAEVAGAAVADAIRAHHSVASLPEHIDAAIVATTAQFRLAALSELLERSRVRYVLLEKVLFQQFADYDAAARLLAAHGVRAWVNCPRRLYPIYASIKDWFAATPPTSVTVAGGEWGMGCNGIHFVDLFSFLTGAPLADFDATQLQPGTVPARRPGYVEYCGTLRATAGDRSLVLTAAAQSPLRHLITLRSPQQQVVIDEGTGTLWRLQGQDQSDVVRFQVPYQSELTAAVVSAMLAHGTCGLTSYAESAPLHLALLRAFAVHSDGRSAQACRVT
jgi:predicted dehydrogenase